jgi:hypothetical protein
VHHSLGSYASCAQLLRPCTLNIEPPAMILNASQERLVRAYGKVRPATPACMPVGSGMNEHAYQGSEHAHVPSLVPPPARSLCHAAECINRQAVILFLSNDLSNTPDANRHMPMTSNSSTVHPSMCWNSQPYPSPNLYMNIYYLRGFGP